MCNEVSCLDFEDRDFGSVYSHSPAVSYSFHENIFDGHNDYPVLMNTVTFCKALKEIEQRIQKTAKIAPMDTNVGGKAEITIEWGGKGGPSISGSISGGVSDDNGNKVEVKVEVEGDGSGKATVSAERDK